jgi:hypothetical protein
MIYSNILTLFFVSGILRLIVYLAGAYAFKEVRPVDKIADHNLIARALGVELIFNLGQSIFSYINPVVRDDKDLPDRR